MNFSSYTTNNSQAGCRRLAWQSTLLNGGVLPPSIKIKITSIHLEEHLTRSQWCTHKKATSEGHSKLISLCLKYKCCFPIAKTESTGRTTMPLLETALFRKFWIKRLSVSNSVSGWQKEEEMLKLTSRGPSISSSVYVNLVISFVFWKSSFLSLNCDSALTVKEVGSKHNFFSVYFPAFTLNPSSPPAMMGHWFAMPVPLISL
jgi:hypothetical protein